MKRTCTKCKKRKGLAHFWKRKTSKDGYQHQCKSCKSGAVKNWNANNRGASSGIKKRWLKTLSGYLYRKCQRLCRRNSRAHLKVSITHHDLVQIYVEQKGLCAISGRKMITHTSSPCTLDALSIDRKDNNKGYTKGNIRLVTLQANSSRMNGTDDQLLKFCRDVVALRGKK